MDAVGYVNAIAALSIRSAIDVSASLGLPVPANWSEIVNGLHIPFDKEKQYHPEFDTYSGQTVKQADTIMLGFPLSDWVKSFGDVPALEFNHTVHMNDLHYYADHTTESGPGARPVSISQSLVRAYLSPYPYLWSCVGGLNLFKQQ